VPARYGAGLAARAALAPRNAATVGAVRSLCRRYACRIDSNRLPGLDSTGDGKDRRQVLQWSIEKQFELKPDEIGEHHGRYRLHMPEAQRTMAKSLERYGQLSPVVVCMRCGRYELIDGFKRLGAVRGPPQIDHLSAWLMEADEPTLKAAIYGLNRAGGRTGELEDVWIIHALVREDRIDQASYCTSFVLFDASLR
jgi:hypothetical protein